MQFPITIGLRRSRFLDGFVLLGALAASLAVVSLPQPTIIRGALLLSAWFCAALAWCRMSPRYLAIRLERSGQISVAGVDAEDFSLAELLPGAVVHPWLTVVRFKTDIGRPGTLIATVDSLKSEDFRRLRVFLRWQADFIGTKDGA